MAASTQLTWTIANSIINEKPIIATKPIIIFSNQRYVLINNITNTTATIKTEPIGTGILNKILSPIAPPNTSASEVETDAITAVDKTNLDLIGFKNLVVASLKHKPVTIPNFAELYCKKISIIVDKVTTQSNV